MRSSNLLACFSGGAVLLCALQAAAQLTTPIGVEFLGRDQFQAAVAGNQPPCIGVNPSDLAGALPQTGWNLIDNQYNQNGSLAIFDDTVPNVGTTVPLVDANQSPTPVTLSFVANDSWDDDVNSTNISKPNAFLMQGIIKSSASGGVPAEFTFNNVPEGEYDLYVLCSMNGDNTIAKIWDFYNITTNYIKEQHQFYDTNVFVQSTATSVSAATNTIASYVKLSGLGTYGRGQIGVVAQWVSGNDGIGIAGLQLVPTGPLLANTNPLSFLVEPISRRGAVDYSNVTFKAVIAGPPFYVQWFKNGTAVTGETNLTYTPAPILASDNGAQITIVASNNLNSITSTNAIFTVGAYITNNGVGVLNGGIVTITTQPQDASAIASRSGPVSFSVAGTSSFIGDASSAAPPLSYQWQSAPKGSGTFTAISGATNATYRTAPPKLSDDGTQFQCVVSASDASKASSTAVLHVAPNKIPPNPLSATVFANGVQVGIAFDEALDPTTVVPGNFKVNGVAVAAAIMRTNVANELTSEQNLLSLVTASPISGPFTININGLKDPDGNVLANTNVAGKVLGLTLTDVGSGLNSLGVSDALDGTGTNALGIVAPDPQFPGVVTNWGDGNFDVLAQGNDYWNNADGFNFLWEPKTNSFDVRVQVVSVQGANNWSAGAIEVREGPPTTNGGGWELARHYFCKVDYGGPTATEDNSGSGANTYEFNCRLAPGNPALRERGGAQGSNNGDTNNAGFSYGWGGSGPGNPSPVPFPNAWIRIARVKSVSNNVTNDHMMGYSSSDGVNWSLREDVNLMDGAHAGWLDRNGKPAGPLSDVLYVGPASVSHTGFGNGNATNNATGQPYQAWIIYRNYGDTPTVAGTPTLSVVNNADGTITLTYTGNLYSAPTVDGSYTKVTGAASPFKVTPTATGAPAETFYRAGP